MSIGKPNYYSPTTRKTIEALWRLEKIILDTLDFNEVVQKIVNSLLLELGYLNLGYEIVVLCLIDDSGKFLERISISETKTAQRALAETPVPFREIKISLTAGENILIKAIKQKKTYSSRYWPDILFPAFTKEAALHLQKILRIRCSLVFPVISKDKALGTLIFSMSKTEDQVGDDERDLIRSFTDIVGIAVENAALYTKLNLTKTKLQLANEKLKELDKLKDEFISLTSHELKTPMTSVLGYLWMVLNGRAGDISETTQSYLGKALGSAQRQVKLVDDMLDVSRIERGKIEIAPEPTEIVAVTKEAVDEIRPHAEERNLSLKIMEPDQPLPQVLVDKNRLKQIVINLVGNAIKYTEVGGITISFNLNNGYVETAVSDTGVGVAKEDLPKLFTKFGRLGSSLTSLAEASGTGLGLYLTKKLVELHKGKIWVGSEPGKGSTFTFSLPVVKK